MVKNLYCPHRKKKSPDEGCHYMVRLIHIPGEKKIIIEIPEECSRQHTNHTRQNVKLRQFYSPSVKAPKQLLDKARMGGMSISALDEANMRRQAGRIIKNAKKTQHEVTGDPGEWATFLSAVISLMKGNINSFDDHTMYLLNDTYMVDQENEIFAAAFSTKNLLLNAKRHMTAGFEIFFGVDTSYRYVNEYNWGLMPITCMGLGGRAHIIAYGFVSRENETVHTFIYKQIKRAIEALVRARVADGATVF